MEISVTFGMNRLGARGNLSCHAGILLASTSGKKKRARRIANPMAQANGVSIRFRTMGSTPLPPLITNDTVIFGQTHAVFSLRPWYFINPPLRTPLIS